MFILHVDIHLNLLAESPETIRQLGTHATSNLGVFIKIDVGYHRTGVDPKNTSVIELLLKEIIKYTNLWANI